MHNGRKIFAVTMGAFLIFSLLTVLSLQMTYNDISEDLASLKAQSRALDEEIVRYENDLAGAEEVDDALIERIAREKLGLCRPGEIIYHVNQ